jgi:hypothetical protein
MYEAGDHSRGTCLKYFSSFALKLPEKTLSEGE